MPVRSLHSSVLKWPDRDEVHRAVVSWARLVAAEHKDVVRVGYFGSYADRTWGVGSDVDLLVIVKETEELFLERGRRFDVTGLPVPADLLLYTEEEWRSFSNEGPGREIVWVRDRASA